jgi:hypothetical protein
VGVIAAAAFALWRTSVHSLLAAGIAAVTFAILARSPGLSPLVPLTLGGIANALAA